MAITGMERMSLQPAAGAHDEWTGLRMIQAYQRSRGERRDQVLVPDSAHGTNPASAALSGLQTVTVRSGADGLVDLQDFTSKLSERVAAVMMTNPNTVGLFEKDIETIARLAHQTGVQLYYDGANLNALVGLARPREMGFDVVHLNLHKTFSTPHGGGGPGAGPVGVKSHLVPFLPLPTVERREDRYVLDYDRPKSIGKVRSFYGNFGMLVRAYAYIRAYGNGINQVALHAVLNASYLRHHLRRYFDDAFPGPTMHEFVLSAKRARAQGVRALDIAKRLIDLGFYPPTIYFPLIVPEALMIEPTETESKATLDLFIQAFDQICMEIASDPDIVKSAPHSAPVGRLDEVRGARTLTGHRLWPRGCSHPANDWLQLLQAERLVGIAPRLARSGMRFHHQAVGADGERGAGQGRNPGGHPGGMARVDDDWVVGQLAHHRHGAQVTRHRLR